ncbi:MAG: outer membrane lipoprotein-sorting protein [Verrucomicrobiota bacterium]
MRIFLLIGFAASVFTCAGADDLTLAQREGRQLASQLRGLGPVSNLTVNVALKLADAKGRKTELPLRFETLVFPDKWLTIYTVTNATKSERLEITRQPEGRNVYRYGTGEPDKLKTNARELPEDAVMTPLAGSDFWIADLGLEFLHWPEQRLLKKELRRGQSCFVLESINPAPSAKGYVRVVSWIDIDTGSIVEAEAYDAANKMLKEFEPRSFQKVNGRWEIKELKIRNRQTKSTTLLEFDFSVPE